MPTPQQWILFTTTAQSVVGTVYAQLDSEIPDFLSEFVGQQPTEGVNFADGWEGMVPKPREWDGSRVVHEGAPQTYLVTSRPWEHTVSIDKWVSAGDLYGVYLNRLANQARQARRWPMYSVRDLLENLGKYQGTPQNGLDGLPYFSTSHPNNIYNPTTTVYSNLFTGGGLPIVGGRPNGTGATIQVGGAFSPTSYATLYEYMLEMVGEDGEPLGVTPNMLMHPGTLDTEVNLVLKNTSFAPPAWATITGQVGAAPNPFLRWGVQPVLNRFLTNGTNWYLFDTKRSVKPVRWFVFLQPVFTPRINPQDPEVFNNHRLLWGVEGHAVGGWGPSFLGAKSGP